MVYFIIVFVQAIIFGFATKAVIENKGYYENWFWWGFCFGLVALIVACAKPQNVSYTSSSSSSNSQSSSFYNHSPSGIYTAESEKIRNRDILNAGGWQCPCGRINASYVSTCTCGNNKMEVKSLAYKKEIEEKNIEAKAETEAKKQVDCMEESAKVSAIKGYKELLDSGIITQEEFDAKKKQLLGL